MNCLYCNESRDAIRASQRRKDPIFCGAVDYFGEVEWEMPRHRFREWTDNELYNGWGVLPGFYDLYRRISNGWEISDEHRRPSNAKELDLFALN